MAQNLQENLGSGLRGVNIMGVKCHDVCKIIGTGYRPYRMPFITHKHCRVCDLWLDREKYTRARCLCCGSILGNLPRLNKLKEKYREALKTGQY